MELNECAFCPRYLDHKAFGIYTKHVGWVRHRKGEGGGVNAMTLPSDTLALAHKGCVDERIMMIQKEAGKTNMSQMPEQAPCFFCGDEVDSNKVYFSRRIGWLQKRRSGGANRVALQSEALGFAHVECIETEKGGEVAWGQESLF